MRKAVAYGIVFAFVGSQATYAGGLGKFVSGLIARGAVSAAAHSMNSYTPAAKSYTADILTVEQLITCLKKASGLDQESDQLEAQRNSLLTLAAEADRLGDQIERRRISVNQYSQADVARFNNEVDNFNAVAANTKGRQIGFNALITSHNAKASAFNEECAKKYYADDMEKARKLAGI